MKTRLVLTFCFAAMLAAVVLGAAPNAPQGLAVAVNGTTVTLTWSAPSTGDVPTGYVVVAALSPGGTPVAALPVSDPMLVVPNVPNGVYYVHVRAVNLEGVSPPSNEIVVSVPGGGPGCNAVPDAATNLAANVAGSLVTLTWTPAATGCPASGYVVQAGSAPGLTNIAVINVGNLTTLSATAPPGTYYVRVVALNAAGGSSPSPEIVVTVGASTPTQVTIGFDDLTGVPNRSPFVTYMAGGFTFTATAQDWMAITSFGNPAPSVQFERAASQPSQLGEMRVTAGGAPFRFDSVDVYSSITPIPHEIIGLQNGVVVFSATGTVPNTFGQFATVRNPQPPAVIDTLVIRLTNPAACCSNPMGIDNLILRR